MTSFIHLSHSSVLSRISLMLISFILFQQTAGAYETTGKTWPGSNTGFYVKYDNGPFDDAFKQAAAQWNGLGGFSLRTTSCAYVDPCASIQGSDGLPGYKFSTTNCGATWGESTLGFTRFWFVGSTQLVDADIVFNANRSWGIHNNEVDQTFDFRRVASHEIGHALGFRHETGQTIMRASYSGSILTPQQDDINGMNALYSEATSNYTFSLCPFDTKYMPSIFQLLLDDE